jgi:hypothetical protein
MKRILLVSSLLLAGCSSTQIYDNRPVGMPTTAPASGVVQVLYSYPTRPYEVIGVVSAKRYKPGWYETWCRCGGGAKQPFKQRPAHGR